MRMLAAQPGALFIGQGVAYDGVSMYHDFEGVPDDQRIEFPVAEELQLGFGVGLAMQGYLPILVYPRIDFLLRAADQLANHLDKIDAMSRGDFRPKVIIRTRVGGKVPLDAGPQHTQNHTRAFREMLTNIDVFELRYNDQIAEVYDFVATSAKSALVVEAF